MANTKVTSHVIANNAISASMIQSAAVTDAKLHSTLDLSGKTLTLPATAIPSASTATTQAASDNSTKIATTAYVTTAISNLVDSAPGALDTLNELAAALGDDASFSSTVTTSLATKAPLANPTFTTAINGADNVLLQLGSSQDLQIWHDATNTNIKNNTGDFNIRADIIRLKSADGGEEYAAFVDNSLVTLNFDNAEKLRTADYGVQISGTGALRVPVGTTAQRPTAATGQLRWNSTDGALEVYNGSAWTAVGTGSSNKVLNTFTGDGSTTTFTLTVTPANEDALMVFIDGAYQEAGDYTLTNNQLALDTAPLSGEKVSAHITTASVHDGTSALTQQFTGDGSTTAFTLSQDPKSETNTQIYINGVYQQKTDYTVSGTTLTFDTAPTSGDIIEVNMFTVATLGNTDTVAEGSTNEYFTNARARSAISVSGNAISYNSSTGVLTSNFEEGPSFTGSVDVAGNVTVGNNDSIFAENNLRFKSAGSAYIDHNSIGQDIVFRTSTSSALDTTPMRIDNTGHVYFDDKVGIGTTPATGVSLDIRANSTTTLGDFRNANASGYGLYVAGGSSSSQYAFRAADKDNNALFSIMGDGKVGIGETSPDKHLHIKNTATGDTGIVIENTNNAQNLDIDFYSNAGSAQGRLRYAEGAGSFHLQPNVSASPFNILYNGVTDITRGVGAGSPNSTNTNLWVVDNSNVAAGIGGAIVFGATYTGSTPLSNGPYIRSYKTNATDGDYGFGLHFGVREMNANQKVALQLNSDAGVELPEGNLYLTGSNDRRIKLSDSGIAGAVDSNNTVNIRGDNDGLKLNAAGNGYILCEINGSRVSNIASNGRFSVGASALGTAQTEIKVPAGTGGLYVTTSSSGSVFAAYQVLSCVNQLSASNTWHDVAYVSHSPNIRVIGKSYQSNNVIYGGAAAEYTLLGHYGSVSTTNNKQYALAMNGGDTTADLEYRYLNSGASSGSYRLQVKMGYSGGTHYVYTTITGIGAADFYEDN